MTEKIVEHLKWNLSFIAEQYPGQTEPPYVQGQKLVYQELLNRIELGEFKTKSEQNPKQGDWVLYNGKPREVYKFTPFGPTPDYPAIVRDPRFDVVELIGIKKPVYVSRVQIMRVEK